MITKDFDPWKKFSNFHEDQFDGQSSDLIQWPIKLWKVPVVSPYFHHAHLLIAADCTAFSCPTFHDRLSRGKVALICCPESDFDIVTKLEGIFSNNEIDSVTVVRMGTDCCAELVNCVLHAVKMSHLPVPVQVTCLTMDAEEVD